MSTPTWKFIGIHSSSLEGRLFWRPHVIDTLPKLFLQFVHREQENCITDEAWQGDSILRLLISVSGLEFKIRKLLLFAVFAWTFHLNCKALFVFALADQLNGIRLKFSTVSFQFRLIMIRPTWRNKKKSLNFPKHMLSYKKLYCILSLRLQDKYRLFQTHFSGANV